MQQYLGTLLVLHVELVLLIEHWHAVLAQDCAQASLCIERLYKRTKQPIALSEAARLWLKAGR